MEQWRNGADKRNPKYSEKTYLTATLATTKTTWIGLELNPGLPGERPATNSPSDVLACQLVILG